MRLARRYLVPVFVVILLSSIYIFAQHRPEDTYLQTSTQIFDSLAQITHPHQLTNTPTTSENQQMNTPAKVQQSSSSSSEAPPSQEEKKEVDPCTVIHPSNNGFIDLRGLSSFENEGAALPWQARGYGSKRNYTLGICSNPLRKLDDGKIMKDGVNITNVGAYFIDPLSNQYVSLGEYATTPKFRGKKLTMTYENGSYCDDLINSKTGQKIRRSTLLTFTCDREMMAKASVSYIGSSNDCNYYFEVRSHHACPTAAKSNDLAAIWIFLIIVLSALLVYFAGYKQLKKLKSSKY